MTDPGGPNRPLTGCVLVWLLGLVCCLPAVTATDVPTTDVPTTSPAFCFPTANRALLEAGNEDRFFVGTVGKPWSSGTFGCVRTDGWQFHEGLDIRCLERDGRGEPTDPVLATADGVVAYINHRPGLSTFGIYVIVRHDIEGVELYSTYAHLARVCDGLQTGQPVRAGDPLGVLGRTANTRQGIAPDRAHVHFELNLLVNDRFAEWHRQNVGSRNDHGLYNGQNFLGIDPRLVLLSSHRFPTNFSLLRFISVQTELCRVAVRATNFPWLRRYAVLVQPPSTNPPPGPVAGYEIHLDYAGVPVRLIPRSDTELPPGKTRFALLSVNAAEYERNPCRRLVTKKADRWELGRNGQRLLDLLTY